MKKIIITMTSWKKRIGNVQHIVENMLGQSKKPDKIVINLSIEEFPKQMDEMPQGLIELINREPSVEINWLAGPNRRQWKKIIPTFIKYPNDLIICCDDDIEYPHNFIECLYNTHLKYPNNPITINKGHRVRGMLQHCGQGTLEKLDFYGKDIIDLYQNNEELFNYESSDSFYTYMCNKAGRCIIPMEGPFDNSILKNYNEIDALSSRPNGTSNVRVQENMMVFLDKIYNQK